MDKLELTDLNLGRVFNARSGCMYELHLLSSIAKLPNLKLLTRLKQLLGSLQLDIVIPGMTLTQHSESTCRIQCLYATYRIFYCCIECRYAD